MAKSSIISRLQDATPKKVKAHLKGMFDRFSGKNSFGHGPTVQKQVVGSAPRTRPGRKSTPRTGKR